ncbi:polyprenyl diphosphate synthase [Actinomadura macra]|uniref:polyprenyl diphosphate synthase n=1 Tax=Actinomadura macra TaxID=46164 RepID=UPI00083690EE|nr:polyprenyl diphosphate synthase [Actinomadura macra]
MKTNIPNEAADMLASGRLQHVAISADGNGRWATMRGMKRSAGHEESQKSFRSVLTTCADLGISYLSLHVFSPENWSRPVAEVAAIEDLFYRVLDNSVESFKQLGVRFRWSGSPQHMSPDLTEKLQSVEHATSNNGAITLQFCLNYGGRLEIVEAVNKLHRALAAGQLISHETDADELRRYFYAPDIPDVDLYIRMAGEKRFSNFLIWQAAYAEFVFTDTLWPDFRTEHLVAAITEYTTRKRTFGTASP